jgi:PIN domain nuclease of toxin-antitoxin system
MKYLLDTHTLLWALLEDELISPRCRKLILSPENEFLVSAASAWEIATKHRIGKLPQAEVLLDGFVPTIAAAGYLLLPISVEDALRAGSFPGAHKDPFDRLLAAQSIHRNIPLLSNDKQLDVFSVRRIW